MPDRNHLREVGLDLGYDVRDFGPLAFGPGHWEECHGEGGKLEKHLHCLIVRKQSKKEEPKDTSPLRDHPQGLLPAVMLCPFLQSPHQLGIIDVQIQQTYKSRDMYTPHILDI